MTEFDWTRAKRWERPSRPLGAMTDKRRRYLAAQLRRLKLQAGTTNPPGADDGAPSPRGSSEKP